VREIAKAKLLVVDGKNRFFNASAKHPSVAAAFELCALVAQVQQR
jgi:hypothetical protein